MKPTKRRKLEAAGWKVRTVADFLDLSPAETAIVEIRLSLSRSLQEKRKQQDLSQQQVAWDIGSSQSRVAKMEAADPSVSIDLLIKSLLAIGATRAEIAAAIAGS